MISGELLTLVSGALNEAYYGDNDGVLIDFVSDTVDFNLIAEIAVRNTLINVRHQFTPEAKDAEKCFCGEGWDVKNHD